MLSKIEMSMFNDNDTMKIYYNENESLDFVIYKVRKSDYGKYIESARDPFSLILKANKEIFFSQGNYEFEHKNTGVVGLFMTPIVATEDQENFYYEIIFS